MFLENNKHKGWIEVICGSMFSGKTEELIRRMKRAQFANLKVEIFKPSIDVRYSEEEVVSHDSNAIHSTPVESAQNILLMTADVDVVGIDEAQFFDDGIVDVCEFFGEPKHMPILLKIYKEDKKWLGALKDLIIGLHTTIDNRLINFDFFGEGRINCGKKCLKGNACRRCDKVVELAKTLEKVNLTIEERKGE